MRSLIRVNSPRISHKNLHSCHFDFAAPRTRAPRCRWSQMELGEVGEEAAAEALTVLGPSKVDLAKAACLPPVTGCATTARRASCEPRAEALRAGRWAVRRVSPPREAGRQRRCGPQLGWRAVAPAAPGGAGLMPGQPGRTRRKARQTPRSASGLNAPVPSQDDILRRAVAVYNGKNWKKIGEQPTRRAALARLRWRADKSPEVLGFLLRAARLTAPMRAASFLPPCAQRNSSRTAQTCSASTGGRKC